MSKVKKGMAAIITAASLSIGGAFAGLIASQNFQCGCEYGN